MKPLLGALAISRRFLEPVHLAVDFTCGNGHDTLALADLATVVYAFDIQSQAIEATRRRIGERPHVHLIQDNFVNFRNYITQAIDLAVFNLGYLPGSDKQIVTHWADVEICLQALLMQLSPDGRVVIVSYPGHEQGNQETESLQELLQRLDATDFRTFSLRHLNGLNEPPQLYMLERNAR